jgi:hypothetical protein
MTFKNVFSYARTIKAMAVGRTEHVAMMVEVKND